MITQGMFLQYFEDVEVPQIPSSTECYRFQFVLQSRVRTVQTAKNGDAPAQFLVRLFTRPLLCCDSCLGLESAENCGGSAVSCSWCRSWRLLTRPLFL